MNENGEFRVLIYDDPKEPSGAFIEGLSKYCKDNKKDFIITSSEDKDEVIKYLRYGIKVKETSTKTPDGKEISHPEFEEFDLLFLDISPVKKRSEYTEQDLSKILGFQILTVMNREKICIPVIIYTSDKSPEVIRHSISTLSGFDVLDVIFKEEIASKKNYDEIAATIDRALMDYGRFINEEGVLITHGTDTMSWGFAVLRYIIKGLKTNIAITGSQMPLKGFYSGSDAIGNLHTSLHLLVKMRPPNIFFVFDDGKTVFSSGVNKIRKWDTNAFSGRIMARIPREEIKLYNEDSVNPMDKSPRYCQTMHPKPRIKKLFLFRTGGTIDAERDHITGELKMSGDHVRAYIDTELEENFVDVVRELEESLRVDSSNLVLEDWVKLAKNIKKHLQGKVGEIDENISKDVRCVITTPFTEKDEYISLFREIKKGIILLCYGGGNGNIDLNRNYSVIPAIKEACKKGKIVVISSQVSLDAYDFEYEAGRLLLQNGAIPSGSLSYPEAQVKLAYILGHEEAINKTIERYPNLNSLQLKKAAFLSGIHFERSSSKKKYEKLSEQYDEDHRVRIMNYDPFCDPSKTFEEAIDEVAQFIS